VAADDGGRRAAARLCSSCRISAMGKGRKETSPRKRGGHGAATNKRAADLYAKSLAPAISEFRAAGHITPRAISEELTRRKVPTARGGNWHPTTVVRLLARLD
jgi:hypothetical protein